MLTKQNNRKNTKKEKKTTFINIFFLGSRTLFDDDACYSSYYIDVVYACTIYVEFKNIVVEMISTSKP